MKTILEYIISSSSKRYTIKAYNYNIRKIVDEEIDRLGNEADLNHIDVSNVTDMYHLFYRDNLLKKIFKTINPDISKWNVSKVRNMQSMFALCENFDCDISKWDVGNVEDMLGMFNCCFNFNQDISSWHVDKVKDMGCMFQRCEKI